LVLERLNDGPEADGFENEDLETLACVGYLLGLGLQRDAAVRALLTQENLAAAGRMLATVAHDMNNSMTVLFGGVELIPLTADPAELTDLAQLLRGQLEDMSGMVTDLLAFVRGDRKLRPQAVDLTAFGREVEARLAARAAMLKVELKVHADPGTLCADLGRLKRIVMNLAKNALDVLTSGGHLAIRLERTPDGLRVVVSDDGPGIPPEVLPKLFTEFFTHGKKDGTGLGLTIVKRFAEDHGGDVSVASTPGRGTSFEVTLAAIPPAARSG
jgi:signal transduction histidine kinase